MKKFFLFLLFFPFYLFSQTDPPVMTFVTDSFNFGTVKYGEVVDHEFYFTNTGKSPLVIFSAHTNCGCLIAEYPKEPIKPGGRGTIQCRFSTAGKNGVQSKTITIEYNNSECSPMVLRIYGNVIEDISDVPTMKFDSTSFHYGKVKQGEKITHDYYFTNTGKDPLVISTCMSACGCDVATADKDVIPAGETGTIHYMLNTEGKMGFQSKSVTIVYNTNQSIVLNFYCEVIPK